MSQAGVPEGSVKVRERVEPPASALAAATIGTLIDWYDFFISLTVSAVVWPSIYFNFLSGPAALIASVFSYIITYVTRPLGSFLFGHYGDRIGRRSILVWTLVFGGAATFGIGLTPSFGSIGLLAPALIILFRLVYGLGMGGEYGGANSWVAEFAAKSKRRGFWLGFVNCVLWLGIAISSLAFVLTFRAVGPREFVFSPYGGWRIPFYIGGVILVIGIFIRYRTGESPMFAKLGYERRIERIPAARLFKETGRKIIPLCMLNMPSITAALLIGNGPYVIAYLEALKMSPLIIFEGITVAASVATVVALVSSAFSDRLGRTRVYLIGMIVLAILTYPIFRLLSLAAIVPVFIALALTESACAVSNTVQGVLLSEQFPTKYRYSGTGIVFNISSLIGSFLGALLALTIAAKVGILNSVPYEILMLEILSVIGIVSIFFVKETHKEELAE